MASASGGVWKTTDSGTTWAPLTDNLVDASGAPIVEFMGAIAETRDQSNNEIVYAGTGEANQAGDCFSGEGILVSRDGGASWALQEGPSGAFLGATISRIVIDPSDHSGNTVYVAAAGPGQHAVKGSTAGSNTGIWKSTDGGATWTNTTANISTTAFWSDLVIDPLAPATLYAGAEGNGVYQTTNGGNTWNQLTAAPTGSQDGRIALALHDDGTTNELFVSIAKPGGGILNLLKSTNGGAAFTDLTANLPDYNPTGYATTLAVSPTNANYVYAAGYGEYVIPGTQSSEGQNWESFDGGTTWVNINYTQSTFGRVHDDNHASAFDANGNLLVGSDGGIDILTNTNSQANQGWEPLNGNLSTIQFYGIAVNPTPGANIAYGGSQDNGTEEYNGSSGAIITPPAWARISGDDGGITRVDPTNPNTVYFEDIGYLMISTDGGATSNYVNYNMNGIAGNVPFDAAFVLDSAGDILYGTDNLNLSTDHGADWTQIGKPNTNGFNPTDGSINAIAVAPSNPAVVYVSVGGSIFVTQNATAAAGAVTWQAVSFSGDMDRNSLAVDPNNPGTAYAVVADYTGGGGHVFKTTNFGASWTDISNGLRDSPADSVAVSADGTTVYVGTDVGVYATADGGSTWNPVGTGLPNVQVVDLEVVPTLNILAAGTHGRGLWEISTSTTPTLTVSTHSLNLGTTTAGTAGAPQTYTISGINLSANVVITAPSGVELSSDGTNYNTMLTLTPSNGTLANSTISARISASAAVGSIGGNITNTSTGAAEQDVSVSGTVNSGPTPSVMFSAASETVDEAAGSFSLTVVLSNAASSDVSIPFTLGGSAVSGTDYSGVTASPLVIPAGQTSGTITGTIIDDGAPDAIKTLTVTLATPTNATLGSTTMNTLTIGEPGASADGDPEHRLPSHRRDASRYRRLRIRSDRRQQQRYLQ